MGHGDAFRPEDHRQGRGGLPGTRVCRLRRADRVHPAGHGGVVCVPARSSASLVGPGGSQPPATMTSRSVLFVVVRLNRSLPFQGGVSE